MQVDVSGYFTESHWVAWVTPFFFNLPGVLKRGASLDEERRSFMIRALRSLGMELIVLFILLVFCQKGWSEEKYTVKPGDSLYRISKSFRVNIEALKKANALEGDSLRLKQVLTIPSQREKKADEDAKELPGGPDLKLPAEDIKRVSRETDSYVVQKGDSLNSISAKVGFSIEEIKRRNGLKTSTLKIGQTLFLARDESRSNEEAKDFDDGEEITGALQTEPKGAEPVAPAVLGKWSNPEERSLFVKVAKTFLGVPYKLGGSTLRGIDCSAFVKKIYEIFDIELPRTAREQLSIGIKVEKDQLEQGDLVFFKRQGNNAHVGIYIGDDQFVHASSSNREVKIDHLNTPYYSKRFLKGVRVKELERES